MASSPAKDTPGRISGVDWPDHPGGEWANVASNWLLWQLKGDKKAAKMFVGKDCSLCTNANWDTSSKRLE